MHSGSFHAYAANAATGPIHSELALRHSYISTDTGHSAMSGMLAVTDEVCSTGKLHDMSLVDVDQQLAICVAV